MPSFYINVLVGTSLVVILMAADYVRKYNTDSFQRNLFLVILAGTFSASLFDFLHHLLSGKSGETVAMALYAFISFFLIAQNITYYVTIVFIDYFAYQNKKRSRLFLKILCVLMVLYIIVIVFNLKYHFFFYISRDNIYITGPLYVLRLLISYFPLLLGIVDIAASAKNFKLSQVSSLIFFGVLAGVGAVVDIIFKSGSITWPCFAAALLYQYFFIIRSDSKLDSLTGIGNRYSFNEFIDKLARSSSKDVYSIVMIDMDHFKEINDTLGHLEGDNALRDMAAIIKGCTRKTDFAARYGGDEFILAAKLEDGIEKLLERIETAIQNQNSIHKRPYKLQMSYGWDNYDPASGRPIKDFLVHIDALMYKNKMENRQKEKEAAALSPGETHAG